MYNYLKQLEWIENNKQIGETIIETNKFISLAIQKCNDMYKVYYCLFDETKHDYDDDGDEECLVFNTIEDAIKYINDNTIFNVGDLHPLKGNKIFNPNNF